MDDDTCLFSHGGADIALGDAELRDGFRAALDAIGPRRRVLALPPDGTRSHSKAGVLLKALYDHFGPALAAVMPALGTHRPMSESEFSAMFPGVPPALCVAHDWRTGLAELGRVPAGFVREVSGGLCSFDWPAQVNRLVVEGGFDLVVSLGQVVPHEVVGMANYSKNLFIGVGGKEAIDRSHWLGAAYGLERVMGRVDTPVRAVLDRAQEEFAGDIPLLYALTVVGPDASGGDATRGLFVSRDRRGFEAAAALSAEVNVTRLDRPAREVVVWLDPSEFRSTWLGNKAIYRTRMAVADGGRITVIAPGIGCFGEDARIDATIRKYGYRGSERIRKLVDSGELAHDLAGAAHLVHGSGEGRFEVTLAAGRLSADEVRGVGYDWGDAAELARRYDPAALADGWNEVGGREIFFVRNPALGLWTAPPKGR